MLSRKQLGEKFDNKIMESVEECKRLGYNPMAFLNDFRKYGGVETAKKYLHDKEIKDGFVKVVYELKRPELTLEHLVQLPEFKELFTKEEIEYARELLNYSNKEVSSRSSIETKKSIATPQAMDIAEPSKTSRLEYTTYRILRDTKLSMEIKAGYEYQCQICGKSIELYGNNLYAETHHIKPLGLPHNGPDIKENILCLCPNHHVQFDYGAFKISKQTFKILKHNICDEYIDYHNKYIFGK